MNEFFIELIKCVKDILISIYHQVLKKKER